MKNVELKVISRVALRPSFPRWMNFVPYFSPLIHLRWSRNAVNNHTGAKYEKTTKRGKREGHCYEQWPKSPSNPSQEEGLDCG
jgi:hypothetical protein